MAHDGDRHRDNVVRDGKGKVLPNQPAGVSRDGDRQRHRGQALAQEHQVGGVTSDVRRRSRRHRCMRRRQRRRIIQARHRSSGPFGRRLQGRRCARPFRRAIRPRSGARQVPRRSTPPMPRDHRKRSRPEGRYPSVRRPLWPRPLAVDPQNENRPDGCHSLQARRIHPPTSAQRRPRRQAPIPAGRAGR